MLNPQISRREFLKLVSTGSLAFALHDLRLDRALEPTPPKQGRITWSGVPLYDAPTFQANQVHLFGADKVLEILGVEQNGEQEFGNPYNTVWYKVENGYSFSGGIQPVK